MTTTLVDAPVNGVTGATDVDGKRSKVLFKVPALRIVQDGVTLFVTYLTASALAIPGFSKPDAIATAPITGTGGFAPAARRVTISTRSADGNTIVTQIQQFTDTGVISGSETDTVTFTFHADGTFTLRADVPFTGTLAGRSGTLTQRFQGTGNPVSFQGQLETLGGTGGLATLHGQSTFVGSATAGAGTYVFHYQFDPWLAFGYRQRTACRRPRRMRCKPFGTRARLSWSK